MESSRTQASSSAISSRGWALDNLLRSSKTFIPVARIDANDENLLDAIRQNETVGAPLIIEGWHHHKNWRDDMFNLQWFSVNGCQTIPVRNIHDWSDSTMDIANFLDISRSMQRCIQPGETERYYGKDVPCPKQWEDWLRRSAAIPCCLSPGGSNDLLLKEIETLMCYIGVGDTSTPAHKDLCASTGHNLMCYTENDGSSFWFMTDGNSSPSAVEYFHRLQQELDHETHCTSLQQFSDAPFPVYVCEQKLGDLVIVPPRSCHQVINHCGITVKMSWSRMTLPGLEMALYHELPIYQRVCRRETYRIKATIHQHLRLRSSHSSKHPSIDDSQGADLDIQELQRLLQLFDFILLQECPPAFNLVCESIPEDTVDISDTYTICDFCGADIFQTYFQCNTCVAIYDGQLHEPNDDTYCICTRCYVEGRTCSCRLMIPRQMQPFEDLIKDRNKAEEIILSFSKGNNMKCSISSLEDILLNPEQNIFRAACGIQKDRAAKPRAERSCKIDSRNSHDLPGDSILYCQNCHASKCYEHILDSFCMHSCEAFNVWKTGQKNWHAHHMRLRPRVCQGEVVAEYDSEKEGAPPKNLSTYMARVVSRFSRCKPLSGNSSAGWYDKEVHILPTNINLDISSSRPTSSSISEQDHANADEEFLPTPTTFASQHGQKRDRRKYETRSSVHKRQRLNHQTLSTNNPMSSQSLAEESDLTDYDTSSSEG